MLVVALAASMASCKNPGKDLTVEQLTAVVAGHQETLKPCYQAALDKQPDSNEFRMQATLHVAKDGRVEKVELERGGPLPNVGSCVEKVVSKWKFPTAEADTYASLPIIFRPTVEPMMEAPRNPFENDSK